MNLAQFPLASTEAKLISCQHGGQCKAKQVPREPRTAQSKRIWRAKPRAPLHEALGEVEAQPCLSREEKGKAPLSVDGIAYVASTRGIQSPLSREAELSTQCKVRREVSLALPNQRALVFSAYFAPLREVKGVPPSADIVAYAASAPKSTDKVASCRARTKALGSANHLYPNAKIKALLCVKSEATTALLPGFLVIGST